MEHEGFWVLVSDPEIRIQGMLIAEGVWRWTRQALQRYKRDIHQFTYWQVTVLALTATAAYSPL